MRTLKKLAAALFITILTASSAFAIVYGQAGYETEGYDEASAWEINSVSVLKSVRDDFNSGRIDTLLTRYFRLTKDLDITSETSWTPIGTESRPFNGVFDGNSHTVKVLMSTSGLKYTGFFGYVEGGVIQNLNVKGKVIGSVNNNYSSYSYPSNADAYNYAGGIAAYVDNGRIENCKFDGQVKSTTSAYTYWYSGSAYSYAYAGGIVAKNEGNIIINNCSVGRDDATTTITAASTSSGNGNKGSKSYASGIIGYLNDTDYNNKITSNYARVTATADEARNRIYGYRNAARGTVKPHTTKVECFQPS